ncbi:helix-turn-helix transcriptional regulator [Salinibacterium sp. SWN248]|uniref:helix-turn-helix domain-containing protein n=1 Tax=Salinibacterium sp. SWN248 TaxID=2792056 RepID=UPI0018CCA7AE|nr:helix-turn-helix transcriptional regulator [Salinibacterium sp. SWN248]MBH0023810.1 helix-turn-helix transcriptional regulator [Salinibacterium sp. SWN248]
MTKTQRPSRTKLLSQKNENSKLVVQISASRLRERKAARLERQVLLLIEQAMQNTRFTQAALAEALGVTAGRISQVLNGDGNLTIASLARTLAALEYEVFMTAESVNHSLPPIRPRIHRAPASRESVEIDVYRQTIMSKGQLSHRLTMVDAGVDIDAKTVGAPERITRIAYDRRYSWSAHLAPESHLVGTDSPDCSSSRRQK